MRIAHRELIYNWTEFIKLSPTAICRRYGWGEEWIDREADANARRAEAQDREAVTA